MYIKSLIIRIGDRIIRSIVFHQGLNYIVDETPITKENKNTGNNVGKSTVLKLIDVCLGAETKVVYTDEDDNEKVDEVVKDYLFHNNVTIELTIGKDFSNDKEDHIFIRNFLKYGKSIRKIDGVDYTTKDSYIQKIKEIIFPELTCSKPSFRQIIARNIRYHSYSLNDPIRYLDKRVNGIIYESIMFFILGISFDDAARKQELDIAIKQSNAFVKRLERDKNEEKLSEELNTINKEISSLNESIGKFHLDEDLEKCLEELDLIKYELANLYSLNRSARTKISLIKMAIDSSKGEMEQIDIGIIKRIYDETVSLGINVHKSFEELVAFHNNMSKNRITFFDNNIEPLKKTIIENEKKIGELKPLKDILENKINKINTFDQLKFLIGQTNTLSSRKGEIEAILSQIRNAKEDNAVLVGELDSINNKINSETFEIQLQNKVESFNNIYSDISNELFGETYKITYVKKASEKDNKEYISFTSTGFLSSGKKQGESLAFDLACIRFSEENNKSIVRFILNDKKELMHGNQHKSLYHYCGTHQVQVIIPILKDKLPTELVKEDIIALHLSQDDKLFRIENQNTD